MNSPRLTYGSAFLFVILPVLTHSASESKRMSLRTCSSTFFPVAPGVRPHCSPARSPASAQDLRFSSGCFAQPALTPSRLARVSLTVGHSESRHELGVLAVEAVGVIQAKTPTPKMRPILTVTSYAIVLVCQLSSQSVFFLTWKLC